MATRDIHDIDRGDYVKTASGLKKVSSTWGVGTDGRLSKPSEGGFGCVTEDGDRVGMFEALAYFKKEDVEGA